MYLQVESKDHEMLVVDVALFLNRERERKTKRRESSEIFILNRDRISEPRVRRQEDVILGRSNIPAQQHWAPSVDI